MKSRQGFVSNSSSSSFIFVGLWAPKEKVSQEDLDQIELYLDTNTDQSFGMVPVYANGENGIPNDCLAIGRYFMIDDEDYAGLHVSEETLEYILEHARIAWDTLFPDDVQYTQHSGLHFGRMFS